MASYGIGANGSTAWDIGTRAQSVTYLGVTPLAEAPGANPSTAARTATTSTITWARPAPSTTAPRPSSPRVAYTPYGEQVASTAGAEATYTFTGKQWEDETGLYYFPYRYYSPDAARWAWRDPQGMVDGPNMYLYVMGHPNNFIDLYITSILYPNCWDDCVDDCSNGPALACWAAAVTCMASCKGNKLCEKICSGIAIACLLIEGGNYVGCFLDCLDFDGICELSPSPYCD